MTTSRIERAICATGSVGMLEAVEYAGKISLNLSGTVLELNLVGL